MQYEKYSPNYCVSVLLLLRLIHLDNACSSGGICSFCAACFAEAKSYLHLCKLTGETPDRNALEIRPEAETPLWDLREHLHEFVSELEVLRPAFKDMPEFQRLEQEVNVVKQTLSFLLNC